MSDKPKAVNPWIEHVKAFARENGITYGEALKQAGATYQPVSGARPKVVKGNPDAKPGEPGFRVRGCKMGNKKRCVSHMGQDQDGCTRGPSGVCRSAKGLEKAYRPKKQPTEAQLANLAKARLARQAKKQSGQTGGYWW